MRVSVRSVVVGLCGLALGSAGTLFVQTWRHARVDEQAREVAAPPSRAPAAHLSAATGDGAGTPSRRDADLRESVRARVAAALAEQRRGYELDLYLQELERAARAQGLVSALEVAPGLAAIEAAYPGDGERGPAFARRMEALARELGQSTQCPDDPPPDVTALSLLQVIRQTPPGPGRDKLVRQALSAISRLPEAEQESAGKALDSATAERGLAPPSPPRSPDDVLAALGSTRDTDRRRALVEEFMNVASTLPLEEQERRFKELDRATAASGAR